MVSLRNGFTLWESLLALSLVSLLTATALPALQSYARTLALESDRRQVQSLLAAARRQALRHQQTVTLCPVTAGTRCTTDWNQALTMIEGPPGPEYRLAATRTHKRWLRPTGRAHITFRADGTAPGSQGHLAFCPTADAPARGRIVLSASGRNRYVAGDPSARGCR